MNAMRHLQRWTKLTHALAVPSALAALLAVAACSKDKSIDQPAKLTPLSASLRVQRVWSAAVDDKKAVALRLGLGLSVAGNRVYAAGHRGDVVAIDLTSGHVAWRARIRAPLSGGTAASGELVLVGSSDGQLFALNPADGAIRWKVRLNGEVLAPAAISERLIAVRTVDGKLHALSPADGHELWSQEQQVPRLSLRGTARPVIAGELVLCGFDNGKVLAANMNDGSVQWEATITPPHGRTELERLADIDSAVRVSGQDVYTVGFQGRVAMLALETGQIWWSHEASSYRGLTLDEDALYVATADGELVALKARTGAEIWRQKALLHRGLSAPAIMDNAVVAADFQGYVHWLDKTSGALAARVATGKARISTAPVVVGNMVLVINERGQISAFRVTPLTAAAPAGRKTVPETPAPKPEGSK
jgi:outer membrane protein assembly factor BamB